MFVFLHQGYCGLETLPLPGRMDSRDDIAAIVSNALNPLALQGTKFTSLTNLIAAAQPQIGSKVCPLNAPQNNRSHRPLGGSSRLHLRCGIQVSFLCVHEDALPSKFIKEYYHILQGKRRSRNLHGCVQLKGEQCSGMSAAACTSREPVSKDCPWLRAAGGRPDLRAPERRGRRRPQLHHAGLPAAGEPGHPGAVHAGPGAVPPRRPGPDASAPEDDCRSPPCRPPHDQGRVCISKALRSPSLGITIPLMAHYLLSALVHLGAPPQEVEGVQ